MDTHDSTLIPPDSGRAHVAMVVTRETVELTPQFDGNALLLQKLDAYTHERFGAPAPREWVTIETWNCEDGTIHVTATMEAPRVGDVIQIEGTGEHRQFAHPVTSGSRVPIHVNLAADDSFGVTAHLVFKGWDATTGLMVFGPPASS